MSALKRLTITLTAGATALLLASSPPATAHRHAAHHRPAHVLLVGTYRGIRGQYRSIQAAVDAAHPGDWILVAAGDYHERDDYTHGARGHAPAGIVITTPGIHLRGMNRNRAVVDGTRPGSPRCSRRAPDQDYGTDGSDGQPRGRNGILVWKANNVSVENLTTCNFLGSAIGNGEQIWWNGGDGSGRVGLHGFHGAYLNATTTFYRDDTTASGYGIFSSNSAGGRWDHTYASNMADSDFYVGACAQVCDTTLDHVWAEYSSLGYSGTNSGGRLVVKNSEFDHNGAGFVTNSQNNDDRPSPQVGACPHGGVSPITHARSCWVFMHNYVHNNNNPNVPRFVPAPTGAGVVIAGGRDDTLIDNRISGNGAWGVALVVYPDVGRPPPGANCQGGMQTGTPPNNVCLYDDWGNALLQNRFTHNGFYGNDTNGDIAEFTYTQAPSNCFRRNTDTVGRLTTSPSGLQASKSSCGGRVPPDLNLSFFNQIACDSQVFAGTIPGTSQSPCPPGANYPQRIRVDMPPLPAAQLPTMPNPCAGVPANPWCRALEHRRRSRER